MRQAKRQKEVEVAMMLPKIVTVAWLQRRRACADRVEQFQSLYPDGLALTAANARAAQKQGLDTIWVACHLMTQAQRRAFILFTLRQRQPHLVTLFQQVKLPEHAAAIESLTWDDLPKARTILAAAGAAARDTARDAWYAAWYAAGAAVGDTKDAAQYAARAAQVTECIRILGLR